MKLHPVVRLIGAWVWLLVKAYVVGALSIFGFLILFAVAGVANAPKATANSLTRTTYRGPHRRYGTEHIYKSNKY